MAKTYLTFLLLLGVSLEGWAAQDPTAPLGWTKHKAQAQVTKKKTRKKQPLPSLQSIICKTPDSCYAVINDRVVSQGEVVNSYIVQTITEESVTIIRRGNRWKLELFSLDIKE